MAAKRHRKSSATILWSGVPLKLLRCRGPKIFQCYVVSTDWTNHQFLFNDFCPLITRKVGDVFRYITLYVFVDHTWSFSTAIWGSTGVLQRCMIALWQLYEKQNGEIGEGAEAEVVAMLRESCFCDSVYKAMHGVLNLFFSHHTFCYGMYE